MPTKANNKVIVNLQQKIFKDIKKVIKTISKDNITKHYIVGLFGGHAHVSKCIIKIPK